MKSEDARTDEEEGAGGSVLSAERAVRDLPYNLTSLYEVEDTVTACSDRLRACEQVRSTRYLCVPFFKPISRPFRFDK